MYPHRSSRRAWRIASRARNADASIWEEHALMRALLAGNWKMNGLRASLGEIRALGRALADHPAPADVLVCPPASLVAEAARDAAGTHVAIGSQDCHPLAAGAFT